MIIVYSTGSGLKILFTEIHRFLNLPRNKVRKRLTKKILVPYSQISKYLPGRYIGRNLTEETVRSIERGKIGYLYSL